MEILEIKKAGYFNFLCSSVYNVRFFQFKNGIVFTLYWSKKRERIKKRIIIQDTEGRQHHYC
jgi:hypothetical protein